MHIVIYILIGLFIGLVLWLTATVLYRDYHDPQQPWISLWKKGLNTMPKYRVAYTVTKVEEETIEAKDFDEAQAKWENEGLDAELFFIEDEEGNQIVFD